MSKKCGKCDKTVYPAEELKCLDKVWHKICFKCTECGMALTMKNYKGFNKLPYCSAHYPQLKATVVADTPEFKRYDQITKQQSQVVYHKEYEANKGNVTSLADDPEIQRQRQVTSIVSQASYTGRSSSTAEEEIDMREPTRSYVPPSNPMGRMLPLPGQQQQQAPPPPPVATQAPSSSGPMYKALYDYDAQDDDEVSFQEGDLITNCQVIDDGWVIGVVKSTGRKGMIPSNYIEEI
jgi:hypothetical protein